MFALTMNRMVPWICLLAVGCLLASPALASPPVPALGFDGRLIELGPSSGVPGSPDLPNRGMLVQRVHSGTAAARAGLEPGDVPVSIDIMRFTSMAGYRHALVCSSDRPSLLIRNVRNGQLLHRSVSFPHQRPDDEYCVPQPPDSYGMSIDLRSDIR